MRAIENLREKTLSRWRDHAQDLPSEVTSVGVYGSWARGESTTDSDLDLVFVLDAGISPGREDEVREQLEAFARTAGRVAGMRPSLVVIDLDDLARSAADLWPSVRGSAVTIHGQDLRGSSVPRNRVRSTTPVTAEQAASHLAQSEEYLRAADHALTIGDYNGAAGTAVDAGINAADCVAGLNLGERWKGAHEQAAEFVGRAGIEGKEVTKHLRRLLPMKTLSH